MAEMTASTDTEEVTQSLTDPTVVPESESVIADNDVSAQTKEPGEVRLVPSPPHLELLPVSPASRHRGNESTMDALRTATLESEEIIVTDQDVLLGRGGLTNQHQGNIRYRHIISIHRQDYVRAQKTEKPQVARRIVAAIRTGICPGRFLRKGEDGKWRAVSDQEAAWKASQALREKSRWSSMKQCTKRQQASPSAAGMTTASKTNTIGAAVIAPERKKIKVEAPLQFEPTPQPKQLLETISTDLQHIAIPPVVNLGNTTQFGTNYMLPAMINTNSCDIFPKDEDVLFGRGGRTNHHPGNKRLRQIVNKYRDTYYRAKKLDKPKVSKLIVNALRSAFPPGRFLRMNEETKLWEDVGDKRAAEKVSQRLREKERGDEKGLTTNHEGLVVHAFTIVQGISESNTCDACGPGRRHAGTKNGLRR